MADRATAVVGARSLVESGARPLPRRVEVASIERDQPGLRPMVLSEETLYSGRMRMDVLFQPLEGQKVSSGLNLVR
jgi:hypothetical protein